MQKLSILLDNTSNMRKLKKGEKNSLTMKRKKIIQ